VPEDSSVQGGRDPQAARLQYGANNAIRDVKEQANLDRRFPVADEWSMRSRCALQRLSRVAVFAGMAGAADTHSWAKPKTLTGQEILQTQSERLIRYYKSRKRKRVAGKRGRSSIESSTSQTSAMVARSIGLAVGTIRSITGFRLTVLIICSRRALRQTQGVRRARFEDPSKVDGAPVL